MIKITRIDHRLLHGQVAFTWIKNVGADCILIASDAVAKDQLRMAALRMAKPDGVKIVMKSVDDSIAALNSGVTDKYNLFIICETVEGAYRMAKAVDAITEVQFGGTKAADDKRQLAKAVFLTPDEERMVAELSEAGVRCYAQQLPDTGSEDLAKLVKVAE